MRQEDGIVAIWDVALTDEEIALLASGVPAKYIRPEHLVRPKEESCDR
jgi:hypothetical protein